jgi:capsular polysaccharide biosynthesis protein
MIKSILERWQMICVFTIVFGLGAFIISALLPAKFQSDIQMIVVQKQADEKVDAFSATKSAEFLSNIFAQAIYTTSFFNSVQDAPFEARRTFSRDPEQRQKEWEKFIDVKKVNNTGILKISVYDGSRKTAEETAKAIAYVLTTNSEAYHGGGERVEVRLIDGPNTPLRPTVPYILPNTIAGAIGGMMIAVVMVYFFPAVRFGGKKTNNFANEVREEIDEPMAEIPYVQEEDEEKDVVAEHFQNSEGTIEFDPEMDELHRRISDFRARNA